MLRQDLSWLTAFVTEAERETPGQANQLMFVVPQFARIVYEGERFLSRQGVLVPFEPRDYEAVVAKGRHSVKLWERSRSEVADALVAIRKAHHAAFTESVHSWVRWLAPDLGVFEVDGALIATTQDVHLRLGHEPGAINDTDSLGEAIRASSREMGRQTTVLAKAVGGGLPEITVRLAPDQITSRDQHAPAYFRQRFGGALPVETKELLAMVEGHLNTHRNLIDTSCDAEPALRAGLITAFHAATSLAQIRDMERGRPSVTPLRDITSNSNVKAVMRMKSLRNLCMHYEPRGAATAAITFDEALNALAKRSKADLEVTVQNAITVMSEGLRAWER